MRARSGAWAGPGRPTPEGRPRKADPGRPTPEGRPRKADPGRPTPEGRPRKAGPGRLAGAQAFGCIAGSPTRGKCRCCAVRWASRQVVAHEGTCGERHTGSQSLRYISKAVIAASMIVVCAAGDGKEKVVRKFRGNPWAVLIVVSLGFFMTLLDLTIVNIAIPDMLRQLHASLDEILWVINAYVLVLAVLLITAG